MRKVMSGRMIAKMIALMSLLLLLLKTWKGDAELLSVAHLCQLQRSCEILELVRKLIHKPGWPVRSFVNAVDS